MWIVVQCSIVIICVSPLIGADRESSYVLRKTDGTIACIVSVPEGGALERSDALVVEVAAPATPPAALTARLPNASRDFGALPIQVFAVPSATEGAERTRALRQIQPSSVEPTLTRPTIDGMPTPGLFVRATFPRDVLAAAVDIVAERTAVAADGEQVTTQTRCRIREEDAAKWR
jgi:hypothetical protein